jgi:hypothetical protein
LGVVLAAGLMVAGGGAASAQGYRETRLGGINGKPMLAVVSLADQHITLYGANGKIAQSPVSSGSKDYETPAGIFSIVQKKEHHRSNIYQDGEMPFMQRITWTGIALHEGVLPGYAASHGCVRLPRAFARDLFDVTELGMRVVIVREDMRPAEMVHPLLFKSKPVPKELGQGIVLPERRAQLGGAVSEGGIVPGSARHVRILESIAAARAKAVQAAVKRQKETRATATRATREAAAALRLLKGAEGNVKQAEAFLASIEKQIETATAPEAKDRAEKAKEKAVARVDEVKAKLESVKAQEQAKRDAAERAAAEAKAAAAAKELAAQAAEDASRATMPVSVLVSRKMRRLYVRRGTHPVWEAPVEIRDVDSPIGTFVFTALDHTGTQGDLRWSVVAMYKDPINIPPFVKDEPRRGKDRGTKGSSPTDVASAKAALDRITIAKEALDIIVGEAVLPGSSLIVSDEGPSREIGKDTDFILIMSGEPQGALKVRQREPRPKSYYEDDDYFTPWGSPFGSSSKGPGRYRSAPSKAPSFWPF